LEGTDPSKPLGKFFQFLLQKALQSSVGTLKNVKRLQSGAVLAETDNLTYSQKLLALDNIAGVAVKASPHRTLSQSKGVVRCAELKSCSNEKIVEELADQGVIASSNIIKDGNKTNTFILSFCTPEVPEDLQIGYIRVPVTPYIPNPLRCFKCQRFGHGEKGCNKEAVCARCAETGHTDKGCEKPVKCSNCLAAHCAFSKDCPRWKAEKQAQEVSTNRNVRISEARKIVASERRSMEERSTMASVVSGNASVSTSTKRIFKSISVQTEYSWSPSNTLSISVLPPTTHSVSPASKSQFQKPGDYPQPSTYGTGTSSALWEPAKPPRGKNTNKRKECSPDGGGPTEQTRKVKLHRPPAFTADPIQMFNKYGALDTESAEEYSDAVS